MIRSLWRDWLLTVTATATLAIGMAAAVTMFAVLHAVLLRKLPVRDQDAVILLRAVDRSHTDRGVGVPYGFLWNLASGSRTLTDVAGVPGAVAASPFAGRDGERVIHLAVSPVTGNLFRVLGVTPLLGRLLDANDDLNGAELDAVLSADAWRRVFGGDARVIGRTVQLLGTSIRIVGVAPDGFVYPLGTDAWISDGQLMRHLGSTIDARDGQLNLVGRLRRGSSIVAARSEFQTLLRSYAAPRLGVVESFLHAVVGEQDADLPILAAGVALVLLVACTNVAGLLFTRGIARGPEITIRSALGATPARLMRQLVAENVVIAAFAAAIGVALAVLGVRTTIALAPAGLSRLDQARIGIPSVLFTLALALATVLIFGLAPAWTTVRGQGWRFARRMVQRRRALVGAQVALALVLSAAAALLGKSLYRLEHVDTGFDQSHLLFAVVQQLDPGADMAKAEARHRAVLDALVRNLPGQAGIVSAGISTMIPLSALGGLHGMDTHYALDSARVAIPGLPSATFDAVSPGYFATLGLRILRGRDFSKQDVSGAPRVAIVSETLARHSWPHGDAIGKPIRLGNGGPPGPAKTIIGIVADTRSRDLAAPPTPAVYLPVAQSYAGVVVVARITGEPTPSIEALHRVLAAADPGYGVGTTVTSREIRGTALARPRFITAIFTALASVVLLLAAIGLAGMLAFIVRLRTREIGVRLALGATPALIRATIVRQGTMVAGIGCAAGLAFTVVGSRVLRSLLYDVSPVDLVALTGVVLLLLGVAIVASYIPAARASRLDPMSALRTD